MAGIFGIVSNQDCIHDLFLGTFYLQHRAQIYCGLSYFDGKNLIDKTHKGLLRQNFPKSKLRKFKGQHGIGSVSVTREPVAELSKSGGMIVSFDGNLINAEELKNELLMEGVSFSGHSNPEYVSDCVLVAKIIAREDNLIFGIRKLTQVMKGDFALVCLTKEGIYAARGWGRKPLILGKKNGSFAVSSESNSFVNSGFEILRDVEPGEIVLLNKGGIQTLEKLNLSPVKFGTFEWVYVSHPASVIDGMNVAEVRRRIGRLLAEKYPIQADLVSPVPNSGRWHALGYAEGTKLPYTEVFVRYDYSDRSYTLTEQVTRDEEAKIKLITIKELIKDKRIILVDDSIVRGTQTLSQVSKLKELGAKGVHLVVACPPLMTACNYGQSTKKNEDCIARRMSIEDIKNKLQLNNLCYADIEILEKAIGKPREQLCLECWEGCDSRVCKKE